MKILVIVILLLAGCTFTQRDVEIEALRQTKRIRNCNQVASFLKADGVVKYDNIWYCHVYNKTNSAGAIFSDDDLSSIIRFMYVKDEMK